MCVLGDNAGEAAWGRGRGACAFASMHCWGTCQKNRASIWNAVGQGRGGRRARWRLSVSMQTPPPSCSCSRSGPPRPLPPHPSQPPDARAAEAGASGFHHAGRHANRHGRLLRGVAACGPLPRTLHVRHWPRPGRFRGVGAHIAIAAPQTLQKSRTGRRSLQAAGGDHQLWKEPATSCCPIRASFPGSCLALFVVSSRSI